MKMSSKGKNIFSSKADALNYFQRKVKNSKIEKMYVFNHHEWKNENSDILNKIQNIFSGKIVVRSSTIGEDSLEKSDAGKYKTILDLQVTQRNTIKNAINEVISSYNISEKDSEPHQILIQKQTTNSKTSGVIFTRTPNNGSPYYVINYEDGKKTDSITSGMIGNTVKIFRGISQKDIPKKWHKLIVAVKEIEKLSKNDKLDIEFAITNRDIVIFQVRPLTMIRDFLDTKLSNRVSTEIKNNQEELSRCKKTIFSNMTDWNPAEIIGDRPNRLDYSIYDFLIMRNSWSDGRELLGYHNPRVGLMKKFSGRAYVNVKASFESLLPSDMNKELRKKLVKFFMYKLEREPYLHDKVEFEILFTCYDFSFKKRMNELLDHGFTKKEINQISDILLTFTNSLIKITPKIQRDTRESLKKLEDELKDLKNPSKLDISILELNVTKFQEIVNLRESELKNTEALYKNAENILTGAKIYAPYDGVITAINKNEGDTITSTQNIMSIANPNTLEFNGDVDEVDILYLSSGLAAKIQTDALRDTELDGTLKSIGSSSNSSGGVTTFSAKIDVSIPNDAALKDGLSATARVITKAKYGINLIPIQSLYGTFDSPTVKVIVNGQVTEKAIEIGDSDSNWVEVISGMNETDMIVMEVPDIPTADIRGGPPSAEPRSNNSRQKR